MSNHSDNRFVGERKPPKFYGITHGFGVGFFDAGNEHAHRRLKRDTGDNAADDDDPPPDSGYTVRSNDPFRETSCEYSFFIACGVFFD